MNGLTMVAIVGALVLALAALILILVVFPVGVACGVGSMVCGLMAIPGLVREDEAQLEPLDLEQV